MLYILLPIYNEEKTLDSLINNIDGCLKDNKLDYRIIACNDGSSDKSEEILEKLTNQINLEIITHKINRGLGETIRDLFERAAEVSNLDDIFVRLDSDNTHDPKFILDMINKIEEGYDVVTASRFQTGGGQLGVPRYRAFISWCAQLFSRVVFRMWRQREFSCGYRAYRASIIKKAIEIYGNEFIQLKGLGFTCTLEKLVKLNMLNARFAEIGFMLRYDKKESPSKMVSSITTLGYIAMTILYNWPFGGWRQQIKKKMR